LEERSGKNRNGLKISDFPIFAIWTKKQEGKDRRDESATKSLPVPLPLDSVLESPQKRQFREEWRT
jgi:hypothetical protein